LSSQSRISRNPTGRHSRSIWLPVGGFSLWLEQCLGLGELGPAELLALRAEASFGVSRRMHTFDRRRVCFGQMEPDSVPRKATVTASQVTWRQ
jgi:hypothetical protein